MNLLQQIFLFMTYCFVIIPFFLHIYFTDVATATDLLPLIPPQTGEKILDDTSRYYLDSLMEFMVTQVHKFLNSNNKRGKFHEFFKTL